MPHYYYDDRLSSAHFIGAGIMGFLWIALFGLGIWLIVSLVRKSTDRPQQPPAATPVVTPRAGETARDILDRRFAVGELTEEQYLAMRKALETPPTGDVQA